MIKLEFKWTIMYKSIVTFKEINAWKKAYELTLKIYKYTKKYPSFIRFLVLLAVDVKRKLTLLRL